MGPLHYVFLCGLLCARTDGSRLRQEDSPPRIVEHPSDLIVSNGEPATLNCKAEGRPTPTVEWFKDGERVETDRENPRSHRMLLPSGSLFFLRIVHGRRSKPDDGNYVCVARNYLGEALSRNASLEVALLRDDFRQNPQDVVVAVGETASFECQPPRGHPEPTTFWRKDKTRLDLKDDRIMVRGGKLTISNAKKSDSGIYVCVASNMVGERESEKAQLSVFERPAFVQRPVNQVVLVDESVEFKCQVHGDPPPALRWKKEDADIPRGRYDIRYEKEDFLLRIKKASVSDQGTFTCTAENRVGKAEASAYLTIRARPVEAPQFVVRPRDQIVVQGRTATFPCETRGKPQPTVFWQREGSKDLLFPSQPAQGDNRVSVSVNGELTISSVQRSDAGYYICQALTVAGSIMAKAQLEVADASKDRPPPIIQRGPSNHTQAQGGMSLLQCQASGDPQPTVTWRKNGANLLEKDPRFSLLDHGSLQIQNTRLSDSGLYTCLATSSSGETSWSAYLDVKDSTDLVDFMSHNTSALPGPPSKPEVTDVTKSSISLSWEPGPEGGSPVSSYVIEAFGQSVSNSWQTVADHVKMTEFMVKDLRPNTVYLFIIRAVSSQGLGDPSPMSEPVRTQDISPTVQGVDHRRVQKELGDVVVNMHNPVVLSSTSVQVTWTVENPSQFIQGYRVLYRQTSGLPSPGPWQMQDVRIASERDVTLSGLKKGIVYEIKVRPYFNEFQGADSESMTARTMEEAPSAPPQQVTVLTVGSHNSTSISVSWDPPLSDQQNGIIQEYKIWCLANDTRFHVNKSVDATIRSVVVGGLQTGVQYRVEVAAGTSAGVGVKSKPQLIILGGELKDVMTGSEGNNSISDVVKQPAFIAGLGGVCWIVLMGFSAWLYWRRKKRKGLSNYAVQSFTFTRAVTFQRDRGLIRNGSRPGLLKAGDPGLPWLADSWPSTSLPANGGLGSPKHDNFGRGDVLPSAAVEKTGTMLSDGAIYSSIDFMGTGGYSSPARGSQPTPYATTQILQSNSFHELAVDRPDPRWKASLQAQQEMANMGYSLTDRRPGGGAKVAKKKKIKGATKSSKSNGTCWANMPLPPPPMNPLPGTEVDLDRYPQKNHNGSSWAPHMSIQTYHHQDLDSEAEEERGPTPPLRGRSSSPAAAPFNKPSSSSLSSAHHEEMQSILQAHLDELTRAYQYEVAKQAWHMKSNSNVSNTPLDFMSSTLGSDLGASLLSEEEEDEDEDDEKYAVVSKNLCSFDYTPGHSMDNLDGSGKASHHHHSDSFGTADHAAHGTHSLGHKRAPLAAHSPQTDKVGTLPSQRDAKTDSQTSATKSLHGMSSHIHSSWAAAASDPSKECMVTVSTLERQHMASWSGAASSGRATLSRGSHKRPGTDLSHNGHPSTNATDNREH
ncbi:roundabout homolog 2 isoform X1 [Austrofundulus limnaeus]|uniref:Roundabout homolog 2-like isoform X1 n=1 Tax=Austrofundulus limnaeus TaxID=52670 RepID=A0A2I4AV73_AUSLI|nr:PREDICTED: roundabout homolog 2-like isoform X1 [Austrofundulus limnaeus]XP_013859388.1 PREDICTED: roundabout homolog 2-like isoform X1 [Austrofundulus limnaeus]XP_013859389.1 PREDICTED: roundabout homolog 2-like isoform X1 [Austrofundulus limnaeus]